MRTRNYCVMRRQVPKGGRCKNDVAFSRTQKSGLAHIRQTGRFIKKGDANVFNFEKFIDAGASFDAKVTVRQRTGQLGFSAGAINRYGVDKHSYAVLYFDREMRVVGIKLTANEEPGAFHINKRASNTYISAKSFLDKYQIEYSRSHRHELRQDTESGLLYFSADRENGSASAEVDTEPSKSGEDAAADNDREKRSPAPNEVVQNPFDDFENL